MRHVVPTLAVLCGLLAPLGLHAPNVQAASQSAAPLAAARVIVKFRADAGVLRKQALSAVPNAAGDGAQARAQAAAMHTARAEALGGRVGLPLVAGHGVADRTQVMLASGLSSAQLAARLAQDSDVEYAVVDQRRKAFAAPNDPLYASGPAVSGGSGGPVVGQWYLRAPDATVKSSIDVEGAWAVTTGSAGIVVAVLDTGLRFDHVDLQGGNVLPGYDFVSDSFVGNDGGGRDADASDPGDWVTAADVASSANTIGCTSADISAFSSWHGTQTLGLIGAATGNGTGMASVGRGNVRVMPLRVLGKCGGFDSDIIAAMRWAAGLAVAGVPTNTTPAKVINMSLGGSGSCGSAYTQAVAEISAAGAIVVASAGNSEGHAVSTPANCPGVIAVAALRHVGTKVGFSDIGPEIAISAPGGNCINTASGSPCLYPLLTTTNAGSTTPTSNVLGGSLYTDSFDSSLGTSFSAPLVAGTVALMLSANPALTPAEVKAKLQSTARAFPTTGGDNGNGVPVVQCVAPSASVAQDQCYCTTSTCGAGMLDAGAAVRASFVAGVARITQSPATAFAGQTVTLSGASSSAASGRSIASYAWQLLDGGGIATGFSSAANAATATLAPSAAGSFTVQLTITDNTGVPSLVTSTVAVAAVPPPTARIVFTPAAPVVGGTVALDGSTSVAGSGRSIAAYSWAVTGGGTLAQISGSSTAATAQLATTGVGDVTVALRVTDSAGVSTTTTTVVAIGAAASGGGGGGGALGAQWLALLGAAVFAAARATRAGTR